MGMEIRKIEISSGLFQHRSASRIVLETLSVRTAREKATERVGPKEAAPI